jgi:hypothetical protein
MPRWHHVEAWPICPFNSRATTDYGNILTRGCLYLQDTMMMGADYYQTESEIASLLAEGKVPIGVGQNTKIR